MPETGKTLAEMTPTRLLLDQSVPVVDTDLHAVLLDFRYGRAAAPGGGDREHAWAAIRLEAPDGTTSDVRWHFEEKPEILGHRFYVTGSRSEVLLYTLPAVP
jgi:hypothetical protein